MLQKRHQLYHQAHQHQPLVSIDDITSVYTTSGGPERFYALRMYTKHFVLKSQT